MMEMRMKTHAEMAMMEQEIRRWGEKLLEDPIGCVHEMVIECIKAEEVRHAADMVRNVVLHKQWAGKRTEMLKALKKAETMQATRFMTWDAVEGLIKELEGGTEREADRERGENTGGGQVVVLDAPRTPRTAKEGSGDTEAGTQAAKLKRLREREELDDGVVKHVLTLKCRAEQEKAAAIKRATEAEQALDRERKLREALEQALVDRDKVPGWPSPARGADRPRTGTEAETAQIAKDIEIGILRGLVRALRCGNTRLREEGGREKS